MNPMAYKKLRGLAIECESRTDAYTTNILRDMTTKDLHLFRKINHGIFNKPQWFPPIAKIDIKPQLAPSNFILRRVVATASDVTVSLTLAIFHVRKNRL